MKIIDISVGNNNKMPIWPSTPKFKTKKNYSIRRGDTANDTSIEMSVHTGTHIDAPLHFISSGQSIDKLPLDTFVGPALVVYLPRVKEILSIHLEKLDIPSGVERILFKTSNSTLWKEKNSVFRRDYVGLTSEAALWLSKRNFKLVGVDYLSVAKFNESIPVHNILLRNSTALLEGINLSEAKPGLYELVCLPVKMIGLEASSTRAILIKK